jgi:hypothetical protein
VHPGSKKPLPTDLGTTLSKLEKQLGMPVWVIAQDHSDTPFVDLDHDVYHGLYGVRDQLPSAGPIALVVHSLGGSARAAYLIARLLQRRCGFHAVVPRHALSAATLLVLGADEVIMGRDAILGPLDAQVYDPDREEQASVLNEVQSLERLRAYSLESIDETMFLLMHQTGKKIDSLLPIVLHYVAETNRPLLEKIDVVHYTERSRILKEAEQYALRLLGRRFPSASGGIPDPRARRLVSNLVENYPEHAFPIDVEEVRSLGLPVSDPTPAQAPLFDSLWYQLDGKTVIGPVEEVAVSAKPNVGAAGS